MRLSTAPDEFWARIQALFADPTFVRVFLDDILVFAEICFKDYMNKLSSSSNQRDFNATLKSTILLLMKLNT
jgi:hypothetical protein